MTKRLMVSAVFVVSAAWCGLAGAAEKRQLDCVIGPADLDLPKALAVAHNPEKHKSWNQRGTDGVSKVVCWDEEQTTIVTVKFNVNDEISQFAVKAKIAVNGQEMDATVDRIPNYHSSQKTAWFVRSTDKKVTLELWCLFEKQLGLFFDGRAN